MALFRPRISALLGNALRLLPLRLLPLRLLPLPLLASPLLTLAPGGTAALAAPASAAQLQALEAALNSTDDAALAALLQSGPGLDPAQLQNRRRQLRAQFPDLRWRLSPGTPRRNGQPTVNVRVSGTRLQGGTTYRLDAEQLLALDSQGGRFNGQAVLREQAILRSGENAPPVSVLIPDAVLTGQRYDVDVIFDEPLDGALTAGGITAITPQQAAAMESPPIELGALAGGGLFKSVQAPLSPGAQTWAVLLVHPQGVVSTTKQVRVVADRRSLEP